MHNIDIDLSILYLEEGTRYKLINLISYVWAHLVLLTDTGWTLLVEAKYADTLQITMSHKEHGFEFSSPVMTHKELPVSEAAAKRLAFEMPLYPIRQYKRFANRTQVL